MGFPNGGEGGVPHLGKIPTFSRFFGGGASLIPTFGVGGSQAGWDKIPTLTEKNFWELPLQKKKRCSIPFLPIL